MVAVHVAGARASNRNCVRKTSMTVRVRSFSPPSRSATFTTCSRRQKTQIRRSEIRSVKLFVDSGRRSSPARLPECGGPAKPPCPILVVFDFADDEEPQDRSSSSSQPIAMPNALTRHVGLNAGTWVLETLVKHYFNNVFKNADMSTAAEETLNDRKEGSNAKLRREEILYDEAFHIIKVRYESSLPQHAWPLMSP